MALVSRAHGTFYGQRTGGAPHRRAVFIGFGPLAGGAAGARERSLKSSHFVAPLCASTERFGDREVHGYRTAARLMDFGRLTNKLRALGGDAPAPRTRGATAGQSQIG